MKVTRLELFQHSDGIMYGNYLIDEFTSFEELIEVYQKFRHDYPEKIIILSLNDLGQTEYTSCHAKMLHNLDDIEGYDLSNIDPTAFENGEHIGDLTTPSEFFIRRENFFKQIKNDDFSCACDRGLTIDEQEISLLKKIHQSPIKYLDKNIAVKIIQVEKSYEAFIGFPNGYFSSDLNPFENYALAKRLSEKYEYELFGIGASLLGFIRKNPIEKNQSQELVSDLIQLYNSDQSMAHYLYEIVENSKILFLKYTESLNL